MGARAHSRRHEGRRIRKMRRQLLDGELAAAFEALGDAAEQAAKAVQEVMEAFEKGFRSIQEQNRLWQEEQAASLALSRPGVPYPTQSGVEAARTVASVEAKVDEMAARMDITLLPWQRDLAIRSLLLEHDETLLPLTLPKRGGKATVNRVVDNVLRGPSHDLVYVDETANLPG